MSMITVRVTREGEGFVSHCLDYDIASQGDTRQEALNNVEEAVSLFLEVASPEEVSARRESLGRIQQLSIQGA